MKEPVARGIAQGFQHFGFAVPERLAAIAGQGANQQPASVGEVKQSSGSTASRPSDTPQFVSGTRVSRPGEHVPSAASVSLPQVKTPHPLEGQIKSVTAEVLTNYEGGPEPDTHTLYDLTKESTIIHGVTAGKEHAASVTALAIPVLKEGSVVVVDGESVADQLIKEARMEGYTVRVVPVSTAEGGLFDDLPPLDHARAAIAYGEFPDRDSRQFAEGIAEDIVTAMAKGVAPKPFKLSTKTLYDAFRVARGTVNKDELSTLSPEVQVIAAQEFIAAPVRQARGPALDIAERALKNLILRSHQISESERQQPSADRDASLVVYTSAHGDPANISQIEAQKRALLEAAPVLVYQHISRQEPGHRRAIVTGSQELSKQEVKLVGRMVGGSQDSEGASVVFTFDSSVELSQEMLGVIGANPDSDLFVTNMTEPGANAVAGKFGMRKKGEPNSVSINASDTRTESKEHSLAKPSDGSTPSGGATQTGADAYSVNITTGTVTEQIVRGEHLQLGPGQTIARIRGQVFPTTLEYHQPRPILSEPTILAPEDGEFVEGVRQQVVGRPRIALPESPKDIHKVLNDTVAKAVPDSRNIYSTVETRRGEWRRGVRNGTIKVEFRTYLLEDGIEMADKIHEVWWKEDRQAGRTDLKFTDWLRQYNFKQGKDGWYRFKQD